MIEEIIVPKKTVCYDLYACMQLSIDGLMLSKPSFAIAHSAVSVAAW